MPARLPDSGGTLLQRCVAGDERAWSALVARYENLVYSEALRVGLSELDAGDVFQYVWIELHRSLPRLRSAEGLARWLVVATRRHSYKVAAQRRRLLPDISSDMVDPGLLPDAAVEELELRQRLERALEVLGGVCEQLLRLLFFQPRPLAYQQIARRTGLAIGSIGPIRLRCLTRLRRVLEEES